MHLRSAIIFLGHHRGFRRAMDESRVFWHSWSPTLATGKSGQDGARKVCFFLALVSIVLMAGPARAASLRNHDAFIGYSRLGSDAFYPNVGGLNGWEGALHIHLKPFVGVEGDVAHYGLGAGAAVPRTTTVLVGPRVSLKAAGINLFVHGMVGGEHSANGNVGAHISHGALAYDVGGGVDLPIAPFFAWRFSLDRISAPTVSPGGGNQARFNTGLVFRF